VFTSFFISWGVQCFQIYKTYANIHQTGKMN
jgi:hypothetical protein